MASLALAKITGVAVPNTAIINSDINPQIIDVVFTDYFERDYQAQQDLAAMYYKKVNNLSLRNKKIIDITA